MLDDDARNVIFQEYMAVCSAAIAKMGAVDHKSKWEMPSFFDMVYRDSENKQPAPTKEDVINHILCKLRGEE